jgi:hypothetical protein
MKRNRNWAQKGASNGPNNGRFRRALAEIEAEEQNRQTPNSQPPGNGRKHLKEALSQLGTAIQEVVNILDQIEDRPRQTRQQQDTDADWVPGSSRDAAEMEAGRVGEFKRRMAIRQRQGNFNRGR